MTLFTTSYGYELSPPKHKLVIAGKELQVEVAVTAEQRSKGLMGYQFLDSGMGMLFDFGEQAKPCFWMKNTTIALSLAFISDKNQIIQLEKLTPNDETHVCSNHLVRYALEVPQGWFIAQGIELGAKVEGIPLP